MFKLKPCPKCGNKFIKVWNVALTKKYHCECTQCHWCGKTKYFVRRAVNSWNRQKKVK